MDFPKPPNKCLRVLEVTSCRAIWYQCQAHEIRLELGLLDIKNQRIEQRLGQMGLAKFIIYIYIYIFPGGD